MTSAVNALLAVLQQAVKADAILMAALGLQGISDRTVRPQRFPALTVAMVEARDFSTGEAEVVEILLTLEVWSAVSRRDAEGLVAEIRRVTEGLPEVFEGFRLVNFRHRRTVSRREVKAGLFVAEASFRAVVE